jgi:hypothetical protein
VCPLCPVACSGECAHFALLLVVGVCPSPRCTRVCVCVCVCVCMCVSVCGRNPRYENSRTAVGLHSPLCENVADGSRSSMCNLWRVNLIFPSLPTLLVRGCLKHCHCCVLYLSHRPVALICPLKRLDNEQAILSLFAQPSIDTLMVRRPELSQRSKQNPKSRLLCPVFVQNYLLFCFSKTRCSPNKA